MVENLRYPTIEDTTIIQCELRTNTTDSKKIKEVGLTSKEVAYIYGCYYWFDHANNACPNGWRIPTKDEWIELLGEGETDSDRKSQYKKHIEGGSSGFNAVLSGQHINKGLYYSDITKRGGNDHIHGVYWAQDSGSPYKIMFRKIVKDNLVENVSISPLGTEYSTNPPANSGQGAYSCRCVKDAN